MPQSRLTVQTTGPGLYEISREAMAFVASHPIECGLLTVFVRHTSCSLLIQENADSDVQVDLQAFFALLVPQADDPQMKYLRHRMEGPDDMPAHIKAALTQTTLGIPVAGGQALFGQWQGLFVFEHRSRAHDREVVFHLSP